jgi:hypothetical protein
MDVAGAMTAEECLDELNLDRIRHQAWHITLVFLLNKLFYVHIFIF